MLVQPLIGSCSQFAWTSCGPTGQLSPGRDGLHLHAGANDGMLVCSIPCMALSICRNIKELSDKCER